MEYHLLKLWVAFIRSICALGCRCVRKHLCPCCAASSQVCLCCYVALSVSNNLNAATAPQ